jgi:hypothetical protein
MMEREPIHKLDLVSDAGATAIRHSLAIARIIHFYGVTE